MKAHATQFVAARDLFHMATRRKIHRIPLLRSRQGRAVCGLRVIRPETVPSSHISLEHLKSTIDSFCDSAGGPDDSPIAAIHS